MTETDNCIEKLQWLFDKQNHEQQVKGISWCCDHEVMVKLSEPNKNFKVTRYLGVADFLEQICKGVEEASSWNYGG